VSARGVVPQYRHRRHAAWTGSTQNLQQHRLGLIVQMVCKSEHPGGVLAKSSISGSTRGKLQTVAVLPFHAHFDDPEGNAASAAEISAENGPRIRVRTQPVIDVKRIEVETVRVAQARQTIEQNDRIDAAAQGCGDAGAALQVWKEAGGDLRDEVTWERLP